MTANPLSPIPPLGPTSGMAPPPGGGRFKPIDPLRVLRQHMWLLIVLGVVGVILGGVTWYTLLRLTPRYASQAQLVVEPTAENPWAATSGGGQLRMEAIAAMIQNEIMRVLSEETLREALSRPLMQNTEWYQQVGHDPREAVRNLQEEMVSASMIRGSTLMSLRVDTAVQEDAPRILSAIIDVYLQKLRLETQSTSSDIRAAFLRERDRADETIRQLQEQTRQFLVDQDLSTLEARSNEANIAYQQMAKQRVDLLLVLDQMQESYDALVQAQESGEVQTSPDTLYEVEQTPAIQEQNQKLRSLRESRDAALAKFGPNHYQIRQFDELIAATEAEKQRTVERMLREQQAARLEQTAKTIESIKGQLAALEPKFQQASQRMTDFNNRLTRYQELQRLLLEQQEKRARADQALSDLRLRSERPDAVRVRMQVPPTEPLLSFPKLITIVPGVTLLVLALGTGLLFLKELLDQRLKSPSDVKLLADAELVGVLPDAGEDPNGPATLERVVEQDPTGLMAESFRQVRTALLAKMDRRGYKTLMFSAAQGGAGTSAIVQNMGTSLAYNGRNVLILDANLRRPAQHRLMDLPAGPGLVEYLQGKAQLDDLLVRIEGMSLSVLPAGDAHDAPPELLEGPRFRTLLGELETRFDLILLDAPPALLATDTQLLAKQVDAMALVIRAGRDQRGMVGRMLGQLDGQRADVLGVILNGVRSSAGGYFRKSYREYYRYRANGVESNGLGEARQRGAAAEADAH